MRKLDLALTVVATFWATVVFFMPASAIAQTVPVDVEQAALAGDWNQVWTSSGAEKTNPEPAELRLIKGHACLALNHNNQSLELFASALNDVDRKAWQTWADNFARAHQDNAIAWYFQGDAHARLKEWDVAIQCFDKAIALDAKCYLALNARGVVTHAVGNTIMARTYFVKATKAKEDFADGYASRGTLNVHSNPADAHDHYLRAQSVSQDRNPALSLIGIGCAHYSKGDYKTAQKLFRSVPEDTFATTIAKQNARYAEAEELQRTKEGRGEEGMSVAISKFFRQSVDGQLHPIDRDDVKDIVPVYGGDGNILYYVIYEKDGSVWRYYPRTGKWERIKGPDKPAEGGVNTDMSQLRRNRGPQDVCNVYGLLYAVPANPVPTESSPAKQ
jgi:Tfp pilus assembly protein PilF